MEKEVIQVEIPAGKKAAWVDGFLKLVDAEEEQKKDERPITERVKTFEDACKELGEDHKLVQQYRAIEGTPLMDSIDIVAYFKLRIITAALNEGWVPQFTEDEERWYPYLVLWFKGELEDKSDEWKDERNLQVPVVVGSAHSGSYVGVSALSSLNVVSNSGTRPTGLPSSSEKAKSPALRVNNSQNYGLIITQERRLHHGEISRT